MRPARFIPHGMGRVSWNELEWNECSQPKPLSFPPSIQQKASVRSAPFGRQLLIWMELPSPPGGGLPLSPHPGPNVRYPFLVFLPLPLGCSLNVEQIPKG